MSKKIAAAESALPAAEKNGRDAARWAKREVVRLKEVHAQLIAELESQSDRVGLIAERITQGPDFSAEIFLSDWLGPRAEKKKFPGFEEFGNRWPKETLPAVLAECTEFEARCFSLFVQKSLPSLNETAVSAVGAELAKALSEDGWAPKRNALVVLSQCAGDFPRDVGLVLRAAIETLTAKESQKDLKLMANSLLNKLPSPSTPQAQQVEPPAPVIAEPERPASEKPSPAAEEKPKRKSAADLQSEEDTAKRQRANNDGRNGREQKSHYNRGGRDGRDRPIARR